MVMRHLLFIPFTLQTNDVIKIQKSSLVSQKDTQIAFNSSRPAGAPST